MDIIYIINCQGFYKIGKTKRGRLKHRINALQVGNPIELKLVNSFEVEDGFYIEKKLHNKFISKHWYGEWYLLDKEDVDYIFDNYKAENNHYKYERLLINGKKIY